MNLLRAGFLQFAPKFGDVTYNVDRALSFAFDADADLLVFPELFNTGYYFLNRAEAFDLAEAVPSGYACKRLLSFAADKNLFIVAGLAEKFGKHLFNSSVIIGPLAFIGRLIYFLGRR